MPDLKKEEISSEKSKLIADFSYDNTNNEIYNAMKTFQRKYSSKRGKISVIAYAVLSAAAIVGIVFSPTSVVLYLALAMCGVGLFYSLTEKKRLRKKVIAALDKLDPEKYHCVIYPEKIEIETIFIPKNAPKSGENPKDNEDDKDSTSEEKPPLKSVFKFKEALLNFEENDESLLLIVNRRQIYCFPKRCFSGDQESIVRDFLSEKLNTDF